MPIDFKINSSGLEVKAKRRLSAEARGICYINKPHCLSGQRRLADIHGRQYCGM